MRDVVGSGLTAPTPAGTPGESAEMALVSAAGLFDHDWYLGQHPDIAKAGVDPLVHYLALGAREGRDPHPLFDSSYYLESNPDVAETGVNPLTHFLTLGAREGRDPNPVFETAYYLERNPDVADTGMNPLVHYVQVGAREGRHPSSSTSSGGRER
jgi:hypothetical protein